MSPEPLTTLREPYVFTGKVGSDLDIARRIHLLAKKVSAPQSKAASAAVIHAAFICGGFS